MWQYDDIAVLVAVAEASSFSGAAEQLSMPTSTVSRRIKQLEGELDIRLIERSSRKMRLTDEGRYLVERSRPSVLHIKESVESLLQKQSSLQGKVQISSPIFLATEFLGGWLGEFTQRYPDCEIDVRLDNEVEDLIAENIDLAIRIGPLKDSQFVAQFLYASQFFFVASVEYAQTHALPTTLNELHAHAYIGLKKDLLLAASDEHGAELPLNALKPKYSSNAISVLRDAVLAGAGIACLPDCAIQQQLNTGQLVRLLPNVCIRPTREIFAVYPGRRHLSGVTRKLIEFLKQKFQAVAASNKP